MTTRSSLRPGRPVIVVMGVSAAGKSSAGRALAERLELEFRDADDLHSAESIAKMAAGVPLTDADRWPWLERVGETLASAEASGAGVVIACSALKRVYRDALRAHSSTCVFVHLTAPRAVLAARIATRSSHFMPSTLLDSQLATIEPLAADEAGVTIDVTPPVEAIVEAAVATLEAALNC